MRTVLVIGVVFEDENTAMGSAAVVAAAFVGTD